MQRKRRSEAMSPAVRDLKLSSRRKFLTESGAAALAAAAGLAAPPILAQIRKPLRLGILNSFSGAISVAALSNVAGMEVYLDRINWTIAGRKVELIKEDDQFNPQIGLQKARKFVSSDEVDMIVGPQASNVAMAILNFVKQSKTFLVVSAAGTDAITWEHSPHIVRTSLSGWQLVHPFGEWAYNHLSKDIVILTADYVAGRDIAGVLRRAFTKKGGTVLKEIYTPLGTADFSPYLTVIRSFDSGAVYCFLPGGSESTRFVQQYAESGIKSRLACYGGMVDETTIGAIGKAALGVVSSTIYTDTLDNAENKRFVPEYRAKTKEFPNLFSDYGFVVAQVLDETLKAIDGDTSNKDRLAEVMLKVSLNAPRGPFRFDPETHDPIQNVYVLEERQQGERIVGAVVDTLKDVKAPATKEGWLE
jgi:branched-chain amino acid transport system substrate-binding protein